MGSDGERSFRDVANAFEYAQACVKELDHLRATASQMNQYMAMLVAEHGGEISKEVADRFLAREEWVPYSVGGSKSGGLVITVHE